MYENENKIIGYAYVSAFKSRSAYRNSIESSIYVSHETQNKGTGTALYREIIDICRTRGFHTMLGVITHPNEKSVTLHKKLGFKKVAHYKEVGRKFDTWIDTEAWQLILASDS